MALSDFVVVAPLGSRLKLAGSAIGAETSAGLEGRPSSRAALLNSAPDDSPFLLRFALVEETPLPPVIVLVVDEMGVSESSVFSTGYRIHQLLVSSYKTS